MIALLVVLVGPLVWSFYIARKHDNMVDDYNRIKRENDRLREKNKYLGN